MHAPAHPEAITLMSNDKGITAMFLPPDTTALIQLMDQGVLEAMKRRYRKAILRKLLLEDEGRSIIDFVKSINIKDVYTIATAWDDVPAMTIIKSWHNLLAKDGASDRNTEASQPMPTVESDDQDGSCEMLIRELDSSLTDDISSWLDSDSSDPGYQLLSDEDIIISITSPNQDEDTYEEEGDRYQ